MTGAAPVVEGGAARMPDSAPVRARAPLAFVAVLVVAATLRFVALDFGAGVPDPRPDEPGIVASLAAMDVGGFFPPMALYGGGYFQPLYAFAWAWNAATGTTDLATRVRTDVFAVRVAARTWSAVLGTATVALVGLAAGRLAGPPAAVLGAALVAVAPLAVREAQFAKADTAAAYARRPSRPRWPPAGPASAVQSFSAPWAGLPYRRRCPSASSPRSASRSCRVPARAADSVSRSPAPPRSPRPVSC
jgi:hypothetical protein